MKQLLQQNKKGLSEMVAYVLLIVIALGLSVAVFSYLKVFIPKEKPECPADINLVISDYSCLLAAKQINLTITNKGLFKADAVYVRLGPESKKVKEQINKGAKFYLYNSTNGIGLKPGDNVFETYDISGVVTSAGSYGLEIVPVTLSGSEITVCDNAMFVQTVACK